MKTILLTHCIENEEARLYDFVASCNVIVSDDIPTMGVDNKARLYVNPDFYQNNVEHIIGLLLHESLHIFFDHVNRDYENKEVANVAMDIIINDLVFSRGYTLPEPACTYEAFNVPNNLKTTDEVYEYLLENNIECGNSLSHDTPETDDSDGDIESIEKISEIIANDVTYEKQLASEKEHALPKKSYLIESINMILGKILEPEFNRSYARPPRFQMDNILMPASRAITRKPCISIYLDTSGSMFGENIEKALGILNDINGVLKQYSLKRYVFDTKTEEVESYDEVFTGGGTEFNKFHETDNSDVVLIITDCEFSFDFLSSHNRKKVIVISMEDSTPIPKCEVFSA